MRRVPSPAAWIPHADCHMAAALDRIGGLLGVQEFPATPDGYARLLAWLGGLAR